MSVALRLSAGLVLVALAAGGWFLAPAGTRADLAARATTWLHGEAGDAGTYWCPMDPEIVRTGTGMCPICSMELVPFKGAPRNATVLTLTDRQVQQAGVRSEKVETRHLVRTIDVTGRLEVAATERRTVRMLFPGESRIVRMQAHSIGDVMVEGGVLLEVTNAALVAALRAYQAELAAFPETRRAGDPAAIEEAVARVNAARMQLTRYGLPMGLVSNLGSKPKYLFTEPVFPVIATEPGTVFEAPGLEIGGVVQAGDPLYVMADLTMLWLYLDLFEDDLPFVKVGQPLEFSARAVPDRVFRAKVQLIEPLVRLPAHTIRARARVGSLDGKLLPGMLVRATIAAEIGDVLAVNESAVLQSGRRDVVIVNEGDGHFRPRLVKLGRRHLSLAPGADQEGFAAGQERYHEVLSGLEPGSDVVVSGNFLLNAEAQFQGILKKMLSAAELEEQTPQLSAHVHDGFERVLDEYVRLAAALVADDAAAARLPARTLGTRARAVGSTAPELAPALERMAVAAEGVLRAVSAEEPDWDLARTRFGDLSRELVGYLAEYAPARFARGELHLFRCPMAEDFGFDLWVQKTPELQNPYMGQRMPECGMSTELP